MDDWPTMSGNTAPAPTLGGASDALLAMIEEQEQELRDQEKTARQDAEAKAQREIEGGYRVPLD